jgi:hypothetical protein
MDVAKHLVVWGLVIFCINAAPPRQPTRSFSSGALDDRIELAVMRRTIAEKTLDRYFAAELMSVPKGSKPKLALKPDAPAAVKEWYNNLPVLKSQEVADLRKLAADQKIHLDSLVKTPVNNVSAGPNSMGATRADPVQLAQRERLIVEQRNLVGDLLRLAKRVEADPVYLYIGVLTPEVGTLGMMPQFQVFQVHGDDEMIVKFHDQHFWIKGIETRGMVDESSYEHDGFLMVTGTKKYTALLGNARTIYAAEPCKLSDHLQIVYVPNTPAPSPNASRRSTSAPVSRGAGG